MQQALGWRCVAASLGVAACCLWNFLNSQYTLCVNSRYVLCVGVNELRSLVHSLWARFVPETCLTPSPQTNSLYPQQQRAADLQPCLSALREALTNITATQGRHLMSSRPTPLQPSASHESNCIEIAEPLCVLLDAMIRQFPSFAGWRWPCEHVFVLLQG